MPEFDPGKVVRAWSEAEAPCPERWSASHSKSENLSFADSVDFDGSQFTAVIRNPSNKAIGPRPRAIPGWGARDLDPYGVVLCTKNELPYINRGIRIWVDG
jgi:hypothetical protein